MAIAARDVLELLDERHVLPTLDNPAYYLAASRLSVYRDEVDWALIVEVLGYWANCPGHFGNTTCQFRSGPGIAGPAGLSLTETFTSDGPDVPTFVRGTTDLGLYVNLQARTMRIRDKVVPIPTQLSDFKTADIQLESYPLVEGQELLRWLADRDRDRDLLLFTDEEIQRGFVRTLPCLLRLDHWHHPNLGDYELPSQNETFQMIANVIETGSAGYYQPTQPPNNHWRNWPLGGKL